jgi:TRIAD3 protein (E3 ubiquitin-protein ligase RNF216)
MARPKIAQVSVSVPRARIRQDPDIDVPRDEPRPSNDQNHGSPSRRADERLVTEAECLQMVLDVLPGISVKYGLDQIQNKTADETRTVARCEELIDSLLEGPYPTEADASNRGKRKREDDESDQELYHQALDSAGGHDTYCFEA